jgi:hypothetical protein
MDSIAQLKLAHWRSVQKTSSYAIEGQDSRSGFTNLNAPGNITLTLPKAVVGGVALQYKFLVSAAHTITVTPKVATDTIRGKAPGASAANAVVGSFLSLICLQNGFWEPEINIGAW